MIRPSWLALIVISVLCLACSSESGGGIAQGKPTGGMDASSAGAGGAGGASGPDSGIITNNKVEVCDGLDNDSDGAIDEDCPCQSGATQECYPDDVGPAEGCKWGTQTCSGGDWGSDTCTGASFPADGEAACCTVLGATPKHELLEQFLAAYPSANMPKTITAIQAFMPEVPGHKMQFGKSKVSGEYVDKGGAGVTTANVEAGRADSRAQAEASMPAGAKVVAVSEPPVVLEGSGCGGLGWGWGSLLVEASDYSVSEVIYLYIGLCNGGDVEKFFYSEQATQVCKPQSVPR